MVGARNTVRKNEAPTTSAGRDKANLTELSFDVEVDGSTELRGLEGGRAKRGE